MAGAACTPRDDFAKIQIARLERLFLATTDKAQRGELKAVDRALKVLDRFDRYHGFTPRRAGRRRL